MAKKENPHNSFCFTINNWTEQEYAELTTLGQSNAIKYMVVGKEVGEEGTPHLQCMLILCKRVRTDGVRKLLPKRAAHLKWVYSTDFDAAKYCSKDGEFEEWGERPKEKKKASVKRDDSFREAFAAPTVREGMSILRESQPRDVAIHGLSIEKNLRAARSPVFKPQYPLESYNVDPLVFDKSILVWGVSDSGKSQFVLAHFKNPLLIRHMDTLRDLSPDHDGIVFDDMSFAHYPIETVIHLLDWELPSDIHVRYGTAHIPAHTVKVFTHNTFNPFYKAETDPYQQAAVERRLKRFNVTQRLY